MNGIFGVFDRGIGGDPETLLRTMADPFFSWSNTEGRYWSTSTIGLGLVEIPGAEGTMPLVEGVIGDRLVMVADIRLDNRDELHETLGLGAVLSEISDRQLVMAAYRQWGEEAPAHLLGDFVFALWDERLQQLLLARDHVGVKCLYYAQVDGVVYFANQKGIASVVGSNENFTGVVLNYFDEKRVAGTSAGGNYSYGGYSSSDTPASV